VVAAVRRPRRPLDERLLAASLVERALAAILESIVVEDQPGGRERLAAHLRLLEELAAYLARPSDGTTETDDAASQRIRGAGASRSFRRYTRVSNSFNTLEVRRMSVIEDTLRAIVREELDRRFGPLPVNDEARDERALQVLPGVDRYSLVPYVEHVLKEAGGGPMRCKDIADRVYALGFEHKWPPKYPDQLVRSINALASPSQHPEKFERVAPRVLRLR
jgi:hypothetical protein